MRLTKPYNTLLIITPESEVYLLTVKVGCHEFNS